ncbi:MAG: hypothetical protein WCW55_00365 [Patescibacteria group bacterium]
MIRALNECEIRLSRSPKLDGKQSCGGWYLDGVITIKRNPNTCNQGLYLIHEALHHALPDEGEKVIKCLAEQLFCAFTTTQLRTIESYLLTAA